MVSSGPDRLPRLFALGANDVRTPLATLTGYARTLAREDLEPTAQAYVATIAESAEQIRYVVEALSLAARIAEGRYTPTVEGADSLELAGEAARRFDAGRVRVAGSGTTVRVDRLQVIDAIAAFARATMRHGGLDDVEVSVDGVTLSFSPVAENAVPVLSGDELREFGAAVALMVVSSLGGSTAVAGGVLSVRLPE